jgi:hypothetical protein
VLVFILGFVAPVGVPLAEYINYPLCIGLGVLLLASPPWISVIFRRLNKRK